MQWDSIQARPGSLGRAVPVPSSYGSWTPASFDTYTGLTGIKRTKSVEPTVSLGEQPGMYPLTVGEGATIDWPWLVAGGPASALVPLELV